MSTCYQCDREVTSLNYRSRCSECQAQFEAAHIKIIIAGGRSFTDYDLLCSTLDQLTAERAPGDCIMIISGTARGADQLGERYAQEREYELLRMPAQWDTYGKSAGYRRNEDMAKHADGVVVFWDGQSRGSKHMIDIAQRQGLPTEVVQYA